VKETSCKVLPDFKEQLGFDIQYRCNINW